MGAFNTTERRAAPRHSNAGVTIIELMVVLVLVAVGILALSGIQTHSTTDVYTVGRRSTALAVAETQMESKRALGYTQAVSDTGSTGIYSWTSVVDTVGPASQGLNRITVTVNWSVNGVPDSVQLYNLVSAR
jgi:prepilin-type N-terminal cleavage/methylation domain-containing protein